MVYESHSEQYNVTAIVTEDSPESYSVSLRCDDSGQTLPYRLKGCRLDQAKATADRWANKGGPMR